MVLSTILISHRDSTQATPRGELNVSIAFGMLEIIAQRSIPEDVIKGSHFFILVKKALRVSDVPRV